MSFACLYVCSLMWDLFRRRQQATRHLYYLQLRKDVLEGGIYVHEETAMLLASYALQAEVGDYNQTLHGSDYFVPEHYLPQRVCSLVHVVQ